jgi:diamine N-acetyltransferase
MSSKTETTMSAAEATALRVTLCEVTADNRAAVVALDPGQDARGFVSSNATSLSEASRDPHAVPRAIYAGAQPVGFLMYDTGAEDGHPHRYSIYRFMIDEKHQGHGYGRAAMAVLLADLKADPQLELITICYKPANTRARTLYLSLGFQEVGVDDCGEMIAEIGPTRDGLRSRG